MKFNKHQQLIIKKNCSVRVEEAMLEANQEKKPEAVKITTAEIREYIENMITEAFKNGKTEIIIKASDIHNAMGLKSRYPMVCNAMRQCMKEDDYVVFAPESGYSSALEIAYLRRKN